MAKASPDAVNELIANGDHAKIFGKPARRSLTSAAESRRIR